jgi:hypothetical protein
MPRLPVALVLVVTAAVAVALLSGAGGATGSSSPAAVPAVSPARSVPEPRIKWDPIPYGHARKHQMAGYSKRHYGKREWRLDPRAIVLHYTATSTYGPAFNTFASNDPSLGERPGVCSQFIVDKDGTIHQLTRLYVRCRHTIGLNHVALGIEMVQEDLGGRNESTHAILDRHAQAKAAVALVAWLKQRYRIPMKDVIGHAMANDSHLFKDLEGWRNDHSDWHASDVRVFRKRVNRLIRSHLSRSRDARRIRFGESAEGRALVAREIGDPDAGRTALIVGQIHGNEPAGRSVVHRLSRRPGALRNVDAWTVVSVNPDGQEDDRRTNAHGVDLNRNFSVGWDGSEPRSSGYYAGPHPFSEPESKALRRLIRRLDPDVTIHYHQPWGAVLGPCSGPAGPQRRYARISGLPLDRCRGEHLPGTVTRWQRKRGETAFVVELGSGRLSPAALRRNARAAALVGAG